MEVLIIEDDPAIRALLQIQLAARGRSVTAMADGESGWESYQRKDFPLVIMDWLLPGMSGLDVCRKIRSSPKGAASHVLMITVRTNPGDLEQVLAAGADDYLAKPVEIGLLDIRLAIAEKGAIRRGEQIASAAALVAAKVQAEEASQAKSAFLGRMSHELRTPLNAILGFAQIMEAEADEAALPDVHRDSLKTIVRSGWHLLDVIGDLLDLSAIESNKIALHVEDVDMRDCLAECVELLSPLAREGRIEFEQVRRECGGEGVRADAFRLKQVLINLLSNAIKYNREGGSISLRCLNTTGRVRVEISDTGPGIPEQDIVALFHPFSRLAKRPYHIEGAGIGLSIAKQLTELMGGTIGVESVYGQGSTFWFELPEASIGKAVHAPLDSSRTHEDAAASHRSTLLYVEDNRDHAELVRMIASQMGNLSLLIAYTPNLGLDLARAHQPDLILVDICLPGMDGYELLERLRSDKRTSSTPVMAISASAHPVEIETGLRAGFRRYFTKPLDVLKFREAIGELLKEGVKSAG